MEYITIHQEQQSVPLATGDSNQLLASFNNHEEACNMLLGKAWFEPRSLGTKAERYYHFATRPVGDSNQFIWPVPCSERAGNLSTPPSLFPLQLLH